MQSVKLEWKQVKVRIKLWQVNCTNLQEGAVSATPLMCVCVCVSSGDAINSKRQKKIPTRQEELLDWL